MADFLGDALVSGAVEVDVPGVAHYDTHRTEWSCPGYPELRGADDIADVGLPAEHQDVQVVCRAFGPAHVRDVPCAMPARRAKPQ